MSEQTNEPSIQDVRRAIAEAKDEIRTALNKLAGKLPEACLITGCDVGIEPLSFTHSGGGKEYFITADITVEVWTK